MPDGIITESSEGGTWAWCGVEVDACIDLSQTAMYNELNQGDRFQTALTADTNYLRQFLAAPHSQAVELRWIRNPEQLLLRLVVVGRILGIDTRDALEKATTLREAMARLPPHVIGHVINDDAKLGAVLHPFSPLPSGMVGITKRAVTAQPQRSDVPWDRHFMVAPLNVRAQSWDDALRSLQQRRAPTMISVALEPMTLSSAAVNTLHVLASQFKYWSKPCRVEGGGLGRIAREEPADAFALIAAPAYQEAAHRYQHHTFRLRISISSSEPIDDGFCEQWSGTISPPMDAGSGAAGGGYAVSRHSRSVAQVDRPTDLRSQQIFAANLGSVGTEPWGPSPTIWEGYAPPPQWMLDQFLRVVDVEEACAAFRFPAAVSGEIPGFDVLPRGFKPIELPGDSATVQLGEQLDSGAQGQPILMERDQLPRHTLVCGQPGSGKTITTLGLCYQLWNTHRVPFLVIDPVKSPTDYRSLMLLPGMEEMVVLTAGDDRVAPFRINPFVISPGVPPIEHCGSLLTSFKAAFGLWEPLPGIYMEALQDIYRDRGFVLDEASNGDAGKGWPGIEDLAGSLEAVVEDRYPRDTEVKSNIVAASVGRARSLSTGAAARIVDCDVSYPIAELLERPTVIELASLASEPEAQSLVVGLLLNSMTTYFKRHWTQTSGLKHVTVIEEAHRLLSRPTGGTDPTVGNARAQAAESFANSLAENRSFGEGIVIVEQVPTKLIKDAIKNSNLKVMHCLPGRDDQEEMAGAMGLTSDQLNFVTSLTQGEAFVSHGQLGRAVRVRMPFLEMPTMPDDSVVMERFDRVGGEDHEMATSLRPFADCTLCVNPCQFRSRSRSVVSRKSVPALKAMVQGYPDDKNRHYKGPKPATAEMRRQWRDEILEFTRDLQPIAAGASPQEELDELMCRFIHLMRRSFRQGRSGQIVSFRSHAARRLGLEGSTRS